MSKESKFLSRVLRHEPDLIGLKLGPGGWVQVDKLLRGMKRAGHRLSPDALRPPPSSVAMAMGAGVGLYDPLADHDCASRKHLLQSPSACRS